MKLSNNEATARQFKKYGTTVDKLVKILGEYVYVSTDRTKIFKEALDTPEAQGEIYVHSLPEHMHNASVSEVREYFNNTKMNWTLLTPNWREQPVSS